MTASQQAKKIREIKRPPKFIPHAHASKDFVIVRNSEIVAPSAFSV